MPQGWDVNATADTITFYEAPEDGVAIVVNEYAQASYNATDVWAYGAWSEEFGYPTEVEFFSDRLIFASTAADPQTLWMSNTGDYANFGRSTPIVDSDAISATINSRRINQVTDLVGLDALLILTKSTEWKLDTGNTAVVAPDTISFRPQSYNGSSIVPALVIDNTAIYAQERGQSVRELSSDQSYTGQYNGRDITAFASHLLENRQIVDWAYQQYPYSAVWVVMDDGQMLCLTYMKEHDVIGWARIETEGEVKSVCVIPEGDRDAVYITVLRNDFGELISYVERLADLQVEDERQFAYLDGYVSFDNRQSGSITIIGSPAQVGDPVTISAGVATPFAADDVGDQVVVGYDSGRNGGFGVRYRITGFTSASVVTGELETPLDGHVGGGAWAFGRRQIDIGAFENERVPAQGNLAAYVDGSAIGAISAELIDGDLVFVFDPPAVLGFVGIPYTSELETLEINFQGAETLFTKNKLIKEVGVLLKESRGVEIGPDFDHMDEIDGRQSTAYGAPDTLDGVYELPIRSSWAERGRFCLRQSYPLPVTILGLIPTVKEGK